MNSVSFEGRTLAAALRDIVRVVEKKSTIPILTCVRMIAGDAATILQATDLDNEMQVIVDPIRQEGKFQTCLPAHVLFRLAKSAGLETITIHEPSIVTDSKHKRVMSRIDIGDDTHAMLEARAVEDWPEFRLHTWTDAETFTNGRLPILFGKVRAAVSDEETRYYLNGICWQAGDFGRRMVATNGHVLQAAHYDCEATTFFSRIIHARTVDLIRAVMKGRDVAVSQAEEMRIRFAAGTIQIVAKLIDGTYPDWNRVVPKEEGKAATLYKDRVLIALERLSAVASERGRAVKIENRDGRAVFSVTNPDLGDVSMTVADVYPADMPQYVGFNMRYVADTLKTMAGNEFVMRLIDSGSPARFEDADKEMIRVVMPMRV